MNHLGVILLLVLGPELILTQLLVYLDFVVLCHAVFVLSLWCLFCVALQLGHRRSCQCTEAVEYMPFSVPSESQALSLPYYWYVCSVLFEILLDCGRDPSARRGCLGLLC